MNLILTISPQRIIMGGGVMKQSQIFTLLREKLLLLLNNYIKDPKITRDIDNYLVPPALGDQTGVLGAIALAQKAANV
jgi:fructokinase